MWRLGDGKQEGKKWRRCRGEARPVTYACYDRRGTRVFAISKLGRLRCPN